MPTTEAEPGPTAGAVVLTLLGTGDAFGSGGRLMTCFHVQTPGAGLLIDCGASVCIAMKRCGLAVDDIDVIFISHFHADHFAGVPWIIVESRVRRRTRPLTLVGPPGIEARTNETLEVLFPGAGGPPRFPVHYLEYEAGQPVDAGVARVTAWPVHHTPETSPHALRLETRGRAVAYSGDTEWTETLLDVAKDADVFLCEMSSLEGAGGIHLDYATLLRHRPALGCRRLVLTHMGESVLAQADLVAQALDATVGCDGLVIRL